MSISETKNILVTHITRMSHPYICIAGIELNDNKNKIQIRPEFGSTNKRWQLNNFDNLQLYQEIKFHGAVESTNNSKEDFIISEYEEGVLNLEKANEILLPVKTDFDNLFPNIHTDNKINYSEESKQDLIKQNENIKELDDRIIIKSPYYYSNEFREGNELNTLATLDIEGLIYYRQENKYNDLLQQRVILILKNNLVDLAITDLRFFNENDFSNKSSNEINKMFSSSRVSTASIGLTKNMMSSGKRYLQLNSFHFDKEINPNYVEKELGKKYFCPLCDAEVKDYREDKPSTAHPTFKCTNEKCDQGNGWPWSIWDYNFPESDIDENEAPF